MVYMEVAKDAATEVVKKVAEKVAAEPTDVNAWPNVSEGQYLAIILTPLASFLLFVVVFYFWPMDPEVAAKQAAKKAAAAAAKANEGSALTSGNASNKTLEAGQVAGDYSEAWTKTFDLTFLIFMIVALVALSIATTFVKPELWTNGTFWLYQLPKVGIMIGVSVLCGLLCRQFCTIDEKGYIMTKTSSVFKVNYTRKVQHLCAYLVPLIIVTPASCNCSGVIETAWGQWVTLCCFLCMIKPVRERIPFFMLQFNSMDRPEDRPHTLKWLIAGNIIWGELILLVLTYLYAPYDAAPLVFIPLYITGLGDGLAEPVGIWFGRHKYKTRSCGSDRLYQRSFEGSACVFLSAMVFTSIYYASFHDATQFWVCFWLLPPLMAIAEATSPHTMDTPFLMSLGGLIVYVALLVL